ncbi:MAG: translocase [Nitrososphaeria archaeon]|nr:translocase [Nitrososphaeria archaeon]NDB50735.1 translocase [Nitrosopumilaceae archaeon]NDB88250.1 translocase [Nitrososphaerota archaeon]NDB46105.1 translocase [Nitrososphaeria archaeon]NDB63034.1 translocase [Nitrosopumilaceae archaeon]
MTLENLALIGIGMQEIVIIAIAAGVLLFGAKKIPDLARTIGRSRVEYEKGKFEAEKELKDLKEKKD